VDTIGWGKLDSISFLTTHLDPQSWGKKDAWVKLWIHNHTLWDSQVGKREIMEEYGGKGSDSQKAATLKEYSSQIYQEG